MHECVLGLQFAANQSHEVGVKHRERAIGCALLAQRDLAVTVLEVDRDQLSLVALLLGDLEVVEAADLLDDGSAVGGHQRDHLLEGLDSLKWHIYAIKLIIDFINSLRRKRALGLHRHIDYLSVWLQHSIEQHRHSLRVNQWFQSVCLDLRHAN